MLSLESPSIPSENKQKSNFANLLNPLNQNKINHLDQKAINLFEKIGNLDVDDPKKEEKKLDVTQYQTVINHPSVLNDLFKLDKNISNNINKENEGEFFESLNEKINSQVSPIKFGDDIFEEVFFYIDQTEFKI